MRRRWRRTLAALALVTASGCGSVYSFVHFPETRRIERDGETRICRSETRWGSPVPFYAGVRLDLSGGPAGIFFVFDVPFSFVLDTALLPADGIVALAHLAAGPGDCETLPPPRPATAPPPAHANAAQASKPR